jgi:hypothetical protein
MVDQNIIFEPSLGVVVLLICEAHLKEGKEITHRQIVDNIVYNYITKEHSRFSKEERFRLYKRVRKVTARLTNEGFLLRKSVVLENLVRQYVFIGILKPLIIIK